MGTPIRRIYVTMMMVQSKNVLLLPILALLLLSHAGSTEASWFFKRTQSPPPPTDLAPTQSSTSQVVTIDAVPITVGLESTIDLVISEVEEETAEMEKIDQLAKYVDELTFSNDPSTMAAESSSATEKTTQSEAATKDSSATTLTPEESAGGKKKIKKMIHQYDRSIFNPARLFYGKQVYSEVEVDEEEPEQTAQESSVPSSEQQQPTTSEQSTVQTETQSVPEVTTEQASELSTTVNEESIPEPIKDEKEEHETVVQSEKTNAKATTQGLTGVSNVPAARRIRGRKRNRIGKRKDITDQIPFQPTYRPKNH